MTGAGAGGRGGAMGRACAAAVYLVPCALMLALSLPALFRENWLTDAPRYTVVSMMMLERGDWWTLSDGYGFYFNKPPLAFWARALSIGAFGAQTWAMKLPEVLAGIGAVAVLVDLVRRLHTRPAAILAGVALAASPQFLWFIDACKLDYLHVLLMLLALRAGVAAVKRERPAGVLWSGVWVGLALLTKPISSLLVLAMLGAWIAAACRDRRPLAWLPAAAAVAVAVAAPWHISMAVLHGDLFTDQYFGSEMLTRARGELHASGDWPYYFKYLWKHHTWWTVLAALGAGAWALTARARREEAPGYALALIWTGGWLLALTLFEGKVRYYLLTVYPGLAWLAGLFLALAADAAFRLIAAVVSATGPRRIVNAAGAAAGLAAVVAFVPRWSKVDPHQDEISRPHLDLIAFVREHPDEEVWNESLKYWSAAIVYINTGRFLRAEGSPVTRDGQRNSPAPPGGLEARILAPRKPDPTGTVFRSGAFVIVRTPAAGGAPPVGAPASDEG